jgi:hypothetical protein
MKKTEPKSHAINPAYPGQLGSAFGNHAADGDTSKTAAVKMDEGRGYEAPKGGHTIHHSGSQGRHK